MASLTLAMGLDRWPAIGDLSNGAIERGSSERAFVLSSFSWCFVAGFVAGFVVGFAALVAHQNGSVLAGC